MSWTATVGRSFPLCLERTSCCSFSPSPCWRWVVLHEGARMDPLWHQAKSSTAWPSADTYRAGGGAWALRWSSPVWTEGLASSSSKIWLGSHQHPEAWCVSISDGWPLFAYNPWVLGPFQGAHREANGRVAGSEVQSFSPYPLLGSNTSIK